MPPGPEQQTASAALAGLDSGGPTAARLRLGTQLRQLRQAAGMSRQEAATAIRSSASKITRLELGRTGIKPRDLSDLLALYGADLAGQASMMALARNGNNRGWWQEYGDAVPAWQAAYLGLEQSASLVRGYEPRFVPELLQTPEYARILLANTFRDFDADRTERQLAVLLRRQQILHREHPPHVWTVIDEGALRRPVGGPAVMRAQLGHLIDITRLRHVNIQVLPFRAGAHAASGGPVSLLRFPGEQLPDVVCLEHSGGAVYPSRLDDIARYWDILNQLVTQADPPIASSLTLEQMRREL
ncbi:MAG TPA: helix-turn-helix transcriptional regulator [Trebonia sp.]|nr:helix-turn-helix transcriptional regulator [Trebonia sp.]